MLQEAKMIPGTTATDEEGNIGSKIKVSSKVDTVYVCEVKEVETCATAATAVTLNVFGKS